MKKEEISNLRNIIRQEIGEDYVSENEIIYKEKSKRINRLWSLVKYGEMRKEEYILELDKMIKSCGGYLEIVEKTVQYYIDKTGEWKLEGDDKYCQDAKKFADKILNN